MLRGAIVGLGNVALAVHAPAWAARRDDVDIVAVSDTAPERRDAIHALLPTARWYDAPEDLLARERLDFVDVCTPPSSHAELVCRALERSLHVLCEKPLVVTPQELDRVVALAEATGRAVHTVHNWHHAPIIARASEVVRAGTLGRLTRVVWQTLRTQPAAAAGNGHPASNWRLDPARAGGGILTDHGWHAVYLVGSWIGAAPTAVSARLEQRRPTASTIEDTATVHITFPDATAEIFLTWAADRRENTAQLIGTDARLDVHGDTLTLQRDGRSTRWACPPSLANGSVHPDWFDPEVTRFLAATRTPPQCNLSEARLCGVVESAARESNRHGGEPVAVPALRTSAA